MVGVGVDVDVDVDMEADVGVRMMDDERPANTSKTYAAASTKYTRSPQRAEAKLHRVAWPQARARLPNVGLLRHSHERIL